MFVQNAIAVSNATCRGQSFDTYIRYIIDYIWLGRRSHLGVGADRVRIGAQVDRPDLQPAGAAARRSGSVSWRRGGDALATRQRRGMARPWRGSPRNFPATTAASRRARTCRGGRGATRPLSTRRRRVARSAQLTPAELPLSSLPFSSLPLSSLPLSSLPISSLPLSSLPLSSLPLSQRRLWSGP